MSYYKDLRSALNSTKMGDKNSKEYDLIMGAKKPLLDILFYHRDEEDERTECINARLLSNIGFWGRPELIEKVYHQICKYKKGIFDGVKTDGYTSKCTMSFRAALYEKCGIFCLIEDDFTYEAYVYCFNDTWGTPWDWTVMKHKFYREYLIKYSKKTGEGFYEKYLHTPEKLIADLENIPSSYGIDKEKDAIRASIMEASKYILR